MDVVLLPGLDGTGTLFAPFLRKSPEWANPVVISYDRDKFQDYDQLASAVNKQINQKQPYILVGESFSGPVALFLAARSPNNLVGVVLCASFATNPRPLLSLLFFQPLFRALFQAGVPTWAIRYYLTGLKSSPEIVNAVASVMKSVHPEVLVARLKMIIEVDVTRQLANCSVPLIYIAATKDRLITGNSTSMLQSVKPDLTVFSVDGPHFIAQSQPVEVWRAISSLIGESANQGFNSDAAKSAARG